MEKRDIEARIEQLKCDLGDKLGVSEIGDWMLSKYDEYQKCGLEPPFDINEYHAKREEAREKIRELEKELGE